ncbi:MAG: hypothetical protein ACE5FF_09090 [Saprospiraceae bacterium]
MARPSTKPKKFKDGFYIEIRNKGAKTGIKLRRENKEKMMQTAREYEKIKDVYILGESKNGTWLSDSKKL